MYEKVYLCCSCCGDINLHSHVVKQVGVLVQFRVNLLEVSARCELYVLRSYENTTLHVCVCL